LDALAKAESDPKYRSLLTEMCRRDLLFFVNGFCWISEPRDEVPLILPFLTYPFQDDVLLKMRAALGKRDVGMDKCRCMGATWMVLTLLFWRWLFYEKSTFMLVSWKEVLVDEPGNEDALFQKLDFHYDHLPWWLQPDIDRTKLRLVNLENRSTFHGTGTTGNIARGGRKQAIFIDEHSSFDVVAGYEAFAATQAVTYNRFFVATPRGASGAFYDVMHEPSNATIINLKWQDHPEYRKGLYTSKDGKVEILDEGYNFPPDYPFICDGKERSPYYDTECARPGASPQLIAQELDADYQASDFSVFDPAVLDLHIEEYCRTPRSKQALQRFFGSGGTNDFWDRLRDSKVSVWSPLDMDGNPPSDRLYYMGVDVSAGTGASNSSVHIFDAKTGELAADYTWSKILPNELAELCVHMARWFKGPGAVGAKMIWEARGPGTTFSQTVVGMEYRNVYWRTDELRLQKKIRDVAGWEPTRENKRLVIENYKVMLDSGDIINRSRRSVDECRQFVYKPDGDIEHSKSLRSIDPTGARDNHGDRVIAAALAAWLLRSRETGVPDEPPVPADCLASFREGWAREKRDEKEKMYWAK
jgi:hypothetical protein